MLVQDIMTQDVETADPLLTLAEAMRLLHDGDFRHLPIVDGRGELVGMLSERDIREQVMPLLLQIQVSDGVDLDPMQQAVSEVMSGDPLLVHPEDDVSEAIELMLSHRVGALPVVDASTGELRGIVSYIDILRAAQEFFH